MKTFILTVNDGWAHISDIHIVAEHFMQASESVIIVNGAIIDLGAITIERVNETDGWFHEEDERQERELGEDGLFYYIDHDRKDPNDCAECARSFGPWYDGECEHD